MTNQTPNRWLRWLQQRNANELLFIGAVPVVATLVAINLPSSHFPMWVLILIGVFNVGWTVMPLRAMRQLGSKTEGADW